MKVVNKIKIPSNIFTMVQENMKNILHLDLKNNEKLKKKLLSHGEFIILSQHEFSVTDQVQA